MKILLISDEYPPSGGGAGIIAKQLAEDLFKLNHEIHLMIGRDTLGLEYPSFPCIQVSRYTFIWPFFYFLKIFSLRLRNYDLIILNDYVASYIAGIFFSKKILQKCVVLVHGNDAQFFYGLKTAKHYIFQYKFFYSRTLKYCKKIITASKYAKNTFLEKSQTQRYSDKTVHHYMGLSNNFYLKSNIKQEQPFNLPEKNIVLFTAARLVSEKGFINQFELFKELSLRNNNIYSWYIAGDGPLRKVITEKAKKAGISSQIIFLGLLSREEIFKYYQWSDIFWLLSKRRGETFGLVYLEAACFGTPSIGYRYAGVEESIKEGVTGFFLDDDCLLEESINKCLKLSVSSCKAFAKKFQSHFFAEFLLEIGKENVIEN